MARLQRPADQQNASNVVGTFEQVVKMLGFVLGGFYVLGLVIANAELQHLGLSDFSILQPRCIATGMLFALYIIFAMLLLAPVAVLFVVGFILLVDSSKPRMARIGLALGLIAACVVLECVFALLTSLFYGSLTPWVVMNAPETYEAYSKLSFSERMDLLANQLRFVWNLFGNPWAAVTAAIGVLWVGAEIAEYRSISTDGQEDRVLLGALVVVVLVFAVTGFAGDVYPNLNQSVGGGQPTIARLQISGILPLVEDGKTFRRVNEETLGKETKNFILTEPLVIWYQSASFIYISPLAVNDRRQRPIAIDAKSVQVIQQVPQAVEVHDGTRVIAVYNLR